MTKSLPGRYIAEVTRTTYDIFAHVKHNNLPGLLLLVDFSKAFDSISFEYINQVLEKFGFNQQTIGWINILLYNFESIAMVNGVPPPPPRRINLGRGCRQGDPIAGYLFIICVGVQ